MEPKDKDAGQYSGWWLLAIAALGACVLAVAYWVGWSPSGPDTNAAEKLGQMGDFFGGMLNPLVSALTLLVAISVWQLQKKELKATQKALDEQAKTAEQQRQEQRFFDLLNVYQRTVDSISHARTQTHRDNIETVVSQGKFALSEYLSDSNDRGYSGHKWSQYARRGHAKWGRLSDTTMKTYSDCVSYWERDAAQFDHYFRVIFHILTEAEALLGDQHIRYIKLFRAQLSRSELIILGFHLWLDGEGKKMLPLAEKYGLLKHLPTGHLRTELEKLHPKVFGHTRAQSLQALPSTQSEANP